MSDTPVTGVHHFRSKITTNAIRISRSNDYFTDIELRHYLEVGASTRDAVRVRRSENNLALDQAFADAMACISGGQFTPD